MNLVFNLNSVEELDQLCKALKETATLQAKLALEKEIRDLNQKKRHLQKQVETLRKEKNELRPETSKDTDMDKKEDAEEEIEAESEPYPDEVATEEAEEPSSLRRDGIQSIERLIEGNEDVDVSPGSPE